jgi:rod shape-determining protein MreB and related proteins
VVRFRGDGSARQLAIDLGTANTVVFRRGEGIVLFEPSVVAVDELTGDVLAVGDQARRMIGRTPAHIRAVRPLRHGVIADFEVTEQMLRQFIRRVSGGFRSRAQVIVCVPSGVTQVERSAVEQATLTAGASRVFLIDEPLAAAIGSGLPVGESRGSLVVDVGGGTSEMAVTALGGMVVSHSVRVGGYELDESIVRVVLDHHRLVIGQEQAEALKLEIGSAVAGVDVEPSAEVAGRDAATRLLRRATINSELVRHALQRPLAQIIDAVKSVLERTPPELSSDIADHGLMLVGGGALLRGLSNLLQQETGLHVTVADDPLTTVARGAGQALEELAALRQPRRRRGRATTNL